jgi:cell division protein FtsA
VGGLADTVRSPIYSTAVGLALYGARRQTAPAWLPPSDDRGALGRLGRRLAGWFNEIF